MKNLAPYLAFMFGCFALGISVMALLGHIAKVPDMYGWGLQSVPMSPVTAVAVVFLAFGDILASYTIIERRDIQMQHVRGQRHIAGYTYPRVAAAILLAGVAMIMVMTESPRRREPVPPIKQLTGSMKMLASGINSIRDYQR